MSAGQRQSSAEPATDADESTSAESRDDAPADEAKADDQQATAPEGAAPDVAAASTTNSGEREEGAEDRSFYARVADDEQERQQRRASLLNLFAARTSIDAGRDWIGQMSNRVSGSGILQQVGRDLHLHTSRGEDAAIEVLHMPDAEATWLDESRLAPLSSLSELSRFLVHEPVVFLRGAENTGRLTAALAALQRWAYSSASPGEPRDAGSSAGGEARVGVIRFEGTPRRLVTAELRQGHGYAVDALDAGWFRNLYDRVPYLKDLAMKGEVRLVVLLPKGQPSPPGPMVDHRAPSALEVFDRRLDREACACEVEPRLSPANRAAIADQLRSETSPQKAVAFAYQLVAGLTAGRTSDDILTELPDRVRLDICDLLAERRPIVGRCFMASVAVLDGLPEVTVSQAALALADHIDEAWHREPKRRPLPTWERLQAWLDYAQATASAAPTAGGGRIVRLNRPSAAAATLQALWEEQPTIREPLISWLRGLSEDPLPAAQVKAAHAVGLLATFDFDVVVTSFLTPWSESQNSHDNWLAALALEAAAEDPHLGRSVRTYLRLLATGTDNQRSVVVRACGSSIGREDPETALRIFREVARKPKLELINAIARSVSYIYSRSTAEIILRELASWVADGLSGRKHAAARAFVWLAVIPPGDSDRPALVELALDEDQFRDDVGLLWRNALTLQTTDRPSRRKRLATPESWDQLAEWLSQYDDRPTIWPVIDKIIHSVDTEASWLKDAVRLHLRLWRHQGLISARLYAHLIRQTAGKGAAC